MHIEINSLFKVESKIENIIISHFLFLSFFLSRAMTINACILICLKYRKIIIEENNFIIHRFIKFIWYYLINQMYRMYRRYNKTAIISYD